MISRSSAGRKSEREGDVYGTSCLSDDLEWTMTQFQPMLID